MRPKKQKRALNTICSRKENYIKIEAQSIRKEMVKNEKIGYQELNGVIELCLQLGVSCFNLSQFVPVGRGSVELDIPPIAWKQIMHIWKEKN